MTKYEFLHKLNLELLKNKCQDPKEVLSYYEEIIADAVDSGANEETFIHELGSVEKICRYIQKDDSFVEKVKAKEPIKLQTVFSTSVKVIGYLIFLWFVVVMGTVGISLLVSGFSLFGFAFFRLIQSAYDLNAIFLFVGLLLMGSGIVLLGITLFRWLLKESKPKLEQLLEMVQQWIRKGE